MPLYEFECVNCEHIEERLYISINEAKKLEQYVECGKCGNSMYRILSASNFKVVGFSAKNGYNLPNYNDVINADGHNKPEWGRD